MNNLSYLIEEIKSIIKEKNPWNYKISLSNVYLVIDPEWISFFLKHHKLWGDIMVANSELMVTYETKIISVEEMLIKNWVTEKSKIIYPLIN